jgi:hypothetical protein
MSTARPTEWQYDLGRRGGTDDWTFDTGSLLFISGTGEGTLTGDVDIVRNLIDADLQLSLPQSRFLGGDETYFASINPVLTVVATNLTTPVWRTCMDGLGPYHDIIGTSRLICTSSGPAHGTTDYLYHYTLPETLDLQASRRIAAADGPAAVTVTMDILSQVFPIGSTPSFSFIAQVFTRTLYQQAV